jgi:hypothetical protein
MCSAIFFDEPGVLRRPGPSKKLHPDKSHPPLYVKALGNKKIPKKYTRVKGGGRWGERCSHHLPKTYIEQNILGYVDRLKFSSLFLLIAQFNNKQNPHTQHIHTTQQQPK